MTDAPAEKPAAYDLPPGYEDEADFLKEARRRFQEDVDFDRENRDEAQQDLRVFTGEHWSAEDKKRRAGRPCLTINGLPQYVAQVTGDIRINRPAIKVRPAKDATQDLADVREGLIRAIEYQSSALSIYADTAQAQVACGIGNFRVVLDYLSDDAFERDLFIRAIPNPFAVVWDAMMTDKTGRDAGHAFVVDDVPRKAYEKKYGSEMPAELGALLERQGWQTRDTVRVTEYWLVKERPAEIALLTDGTVKELTKANSASLKAHIQKNAKGEPMVRKTVRKSVCMYLISGTKILEKPVEYQISRIPIFRVPGWEVNDGTKTIRFGLVRFARDAAKLKSYWRSVSAEVLALAPRQQWLIHENKTGDNDDFREAAQSADTVLTWSGSIKPERMEPPPINSAVLQEAALNAQDMKDVTGLHDASLGARSNETSGKAILARQREGDVATYLYQDNLKSAIAEAGKVVNEWIPQTYDTVREIRVLGADETQRIMRVNDPGDPDSVDLSQGKYDIVVETGPSYSTKRVEAAESMMAFIQAVPTAGQVAGDLVAKAQDWPLADEIGDRLKTVLPQGLIKPDPTKMTPDEQQQFMQQQAQAQQQAQEQAQMQRQGAQLNLAQLQANVMKTQAEAQHRAAEAQRLAPGEPIYPEDQGIRAADLRIAEANAAAAEANAGIAMFKLQELTRSPSTAISEAVQAAAIAHQEVVKAASDTHDLMMKPLDAAHSVADLNTKLNPPDPAEEAAQPAA